jgi:hypothetical protein
MCKFCDSYFGMTTESTCFKVNTNVDGISFAMIAQGDKKAEIVLATDNGVYRVEIDKCPGCGRDLN